MAMSAGFRRVLAVALLVLVLVAAWRFAATPLWQLWSEDREQVANQRDAIARFRALAAARPEFEAALVELRRQSGASDALIRSRSATLAAADLQQRLKSLVETAGGTMISAQPGEPAEAGPFKRVSLSVRMLMSIEALQKVLHQLETGAPLVVVEDMQILSRQSRATRRRGRSARVPASSGELDVRATLAAFVAVSAAGRSG